MPIVRGNVRLEKTRQLREASVDWSVEKQDVFA